MQFQVYVTTVLPISLIIFKIKSTRLQKNLSKGWQKPISVEHYIISPLCMGDNVTLAAAVLNHTQLITSHRITQGQFILHMFGSTRIAQDVSDPDSTSDGTAVTYKLS